MDLLHNCELRVLTLPSGMLSNFCLSVMQVWKTVTVEEQAGCNALKYLRVNSVSILIDCYPSISILSPQYICNQAERVLELGGFVIMMYFKDN